MFYNKFLTILVLLAVSFAFLSAKSHKQSKDQPVEAGIGSFLGAVELDLTKVHKGGRFPNIAVAMDGTVLAVWNGVVVKRSEDGGDNGFGHFGANRRTLNKRSREKVGGDCGERGSVEMDHPSSGWEKDKMATGGEGT